MWIDLEHICHPETIERCVQWWNMLTILCGHNWLSKRSLKNPTFLYIFWSERGSNALNMRKKFCHDFLLAHGKERIVHGAIIAKVDEMLSTIFGWFAKIAMLYHSHKGVTTITNVDPVAL